MGGAAVVGGKVPSRKAIGMSFIYMHELVGEKKECRVRMLEMSQTGPQQAKWPESEGTGETEFLKTSLACLLLHESLSTLWWFTV